LPFQPPSRPPAQLPFPPPFPPNQSYTPVTSSLPPPPPVATPEQEKFNLELEEKRKALAAIAAKFSSLPGAPAPAVPFEAKEGESFANKMMRKWGHKEGSAIGARGDGLTEALTVEHMAAQAKNPAQMSKRQLAKQKAAEANAKSRKWVQHSTARGKIINAAEEERQKEEKGKYGEASRVVCLVGVVGDIEEVDDDLAQDIGEECSKYGSVFVCWDIDQADQQYCGACCTAHGGASTGRSGGELAGVCGVHRYGRSLAKHQRARWTVLRGKEDCKLHRARSVRD